MSTVKRVPKPVKYPGGQHYAAPLIVETFPQHTTYVESFAGGLSVLLAKDYEGVSEVVNDKSGAVSNFWRVLQDTNKFAEFQRKVEATPFSELDWIEAATMMEYRPTCEIKWAWAFFVNCRQSLAGRMESFTSISTSRLRRGQNEQVSAWLTSVEGLPLVHSRMKRVLILNRNGVEVTQQFDKEGVLQYADPPFHPDTRTSPEVYEHEMTAEQHDELLDAMNGLKYAKVALSGYRCDAYDRKLKNWNRKDFTMPNNASGGKMKRRMETSLWTNY